MCTETAEPSHAHAGKHTHMHTFSPIVANTRLFIDPALLADLTTALKVQCLFLTCSGLLFPPCSEDDQKPLFITAMMLLDLQMSAWPCLSVALARSLSLSPLRKSLIEPLLTLQFAFLSKRKSTRGEWDPSCNASGSEYRRHVVFNKSPQNISGF